MMKTYTVADIFTSKLFCTQTVCVVMKQHQTTHACSHMHTIVRNDNGCYKIGSNININTVFGRTLDIATPQPFILSCTQLAQPLQELHNASINAGHCLLSSVKNCLNISDCLG